MRFFVEQRRTISGMLPSSAFVFATIVAIDEKENLIKLTVEPSGTETGWCHSINCGIFPTTAEEKGKWVGQEVLAGVVSGSDGTEQYVVLGLIE